MAAWTFERVANPLARWIRGCSWVCLRARMCSLLRCSPFLMLCFILLLLLLWNPFLSVSEFPILSRLMTVLSRFRPNLYVVFFLFEFFLFFYCFLFLSFLFRDLPLESLHHPELFFWFPTFFLYFFTINFFLILVFTEECLHQTLQTFRQDPWLLKMVI